MGLGVLMNRSWRKIHSMMIQVGYTLPSSSFLPPSLPLKVLSLMPLLVIYTPRPIALAIWRRERLVLDKQQRPLFPSVSPGLRNSSSIGYSFTPVEVIKWIDHTP